jgi:chemotaxis protein MotB
MKKKHPEHVNLERWLVSYADFITLLFAFFVIMYATAKTDSKKFKTVADSIRAAFGGQMDLGGAGGGETMNLFENEEAPGGRMMSLPAGKADTMADPEPGLQELRDLLEEAVGLELGVAEEDGRLQMVFDSRGLVLSLGARDLYGPGEVEVREDFRPLLDRVGRVLLKSEQLIRIEGHTDDSELGLTRYANGWELAAARAAWVARSWARRFDFDPARIGVTGYGHHRPALSPEGDNETIKPGEPVSVAERARKREWARAANRRIEIVVLKTRFESAQSRTGSRRRDARAHPVSHPAEAAGKKELGVGEAASATEPAK